MQPEEERLGVAAYVSLPIGVVTPPPGSVFTVPAGLGAVLTTSVLVASASRLLFETLSNTYGGAWTNPATAIEREISIDFVELVSDPARRRRRGATQ